MTIFHFQRKKRTEKERFSLEPLTYRFLRSFFALTALVTALIFAELMRRGGAEVSPKDIPYFTAMLEHAVVSALLIPSLALLLDLAQKRA